jgi:7-keto-8-aminopelargonate synthetase-like enzyme
MDGDVVPVRALLDFAERHNALLVLDEAHATGVLGEHGRGVTDGLTPTERRSDRLIKAGTLSKALGSQGGFVCGSRQLIRWLVNHARPYIFSTALAPPAAAAARAALRVVRTEPERRQRLLSLADTLRRELRGMGIGAGPSRSPIVPVIIGESRRTLSLARRLEGQGLLVPAIRPPSVPEGTARLRISVTAGHTPADVERLASALRVTQCCH